MKPFITLFAVLVMLPINLFALGLFLVAEVVRLLARSGNLTCAAAGLASWAVLLRFGGVL